MKKKLSLSKKTLRNLSVRSGVNTGGSLVNQTQDCQVTTSIAFTADCEVLSLKGPRRSVGSIGPAPITGQCETKGCGL